MAAWLATIAAQAASTAGARRSSSARRICRISLALASTLRRFARRSAAAIRARVNRAARSGSGAAASTGILGRTETTTRKLAGRARAKVQGQAAVPDADLATQRAVVEAFLTAARDGDLTELVAVLAPDVVIRADWGPAAGARRVVRGSAAVAREAVRYARLAAEAQIALVNGAAGIVVGTLARPVTVLALTVQDGAVVEIDIFADRDRLGRLFSHTEDDRD